MSFNHQSGTVSVYESVHFLEKNDEALSENLSEDDVNEHSAQIHDQPAARRHTHSHGSRCLQNIKTIRDELLNFI